MNIKLIYYTGKGRIDERTFAARLLQFTKNTRLQMTPDAFEEFMALPPESKELEYMSNTIASSWEFVDLVFAINGISRACAQQITRTRTASYAMQSQRVTNMKDVTCYIPDSLPRDQLTRYEMVLSMAIISYEKLVDAGVSLEDARGVLPLNSHCNLIAKYNLRSWVDLVRARSSMRVQGEYRDVIHDMRIEVLDVWPWVATFITPKQDKAIQLIEDTARELPSEQRIQLAKAADLLKKEKA
jgi:flavin-dependent thymidylate synthase